MKTPKLQLLIAKKSKERNIKQWCIDCYMPDIPTDGAQIINWSHHTLTLNFAFQMFKSDMAGSKEQYFKSTLWFLYMLEAYLTQDERRLLEADLKLLNNEIVRIKTEVKNDESIRSQILDLKENFADTHRALGFTAFSRSGIVYPTDDGEIDFDKLSLEKVRQVVQAPFGEDKGLKRSIANAMHEAKSDG